MRTLEEKLATKLRKAAERQAHRDKVMARHPINVRYAKAKFKKGRKAKHKSIKVKIGVQ
jgi:hypothetical protein